MNMFRAAALVATSLAVAMPAFGQGIPWAQSPEEVGFVATRLKRLSDRIEEGVRNNELPGAVVLIARNGKIVHLQAQGYADLATKKPMQKDALMRIASMTKPIVTVAASTKLGASTVALASRVSVSSCCSCRAIAFQSPVADSAASAMLASVSVIAVVPVRSAPRYS